VNSGSQTIYMIRRGIATGQVQVSHGQRLLRKVVFFFSSRRRHTRSVSAFLLNRSSDLHQQTQNQRYGSSHIGATAKDISNVVTDAASGVVDIFHGIDKAVADTWNNFWKDGKADGIGSNLSRK